MQKKDLDLLITIRKDIDYLVDKYDEKKKRKRLAEKEAILLFVHFNDAFELGEPIEEIQFQLETILKKFGVEDVINVDVYRTGTNAVIEVCCEDCKTKCLNNYNLIRKNYKLEVEQYKCKK